MTQPNAGIEVIASPYPPGFGVGPFYSDSATEAEKEFANEEASKAALVLRRPSQGLIDLFRHLAETVGDGRYVVTSADWLQTMFTATKGLGEEQMKRLWDFDWTERQTSAGDLRRELLAALKAV